MRASGVRSGTVLAGCDGRDQHKRNIPCIEMNVVSMVAVAVTLCKGKYLQCKYAV